MLQQRTIKTITRAVGMGLHSGQRVEMTLRPAQPDTGIVFRRVDLPEPVDMPIHAQAIVDTRMASTIGVGNAKVHTIEHLMSALYGLGIDNLYVDITAEEVPILDGSSSSFVFLLQSAGIELQNAAKKFIRIKQPVEVREGEGKSLKWARFDPYHGFKLKFDIDFSHPAVDSTGQSFEFDMGEGNYMRDIARARTFGFTKDVEMLRTNGLVTSRRGTPRVILGTARTQSFYELMSFTAWARAIGEEPGGRTITIDHRPADEPVTPGA